MICFNCLEECQPAMESSNIKKEYQAFLPRCTECKAKGISSLFQAAIQQYRTVLKYPGNENVTDARTGQVRDPANLYTWSIGGEYTSGTNILGLVFFAGDNKTVNSIFHVTNFFLFDQTHKQVNIIYPCPYTASLDDVKTSQTSFKFSRTIIMIIYPPE